MSRIFRIKGVISKIKIVREPIAKEGVITKKKVLFNFEKEVPAYDEKHALEKIYSLFGSVFKVKRTQIKILEIKEISKEEVKDKKLRKFIEIK